MKRITYLEKALEVALSLLSDSDFKEWRKEIEVFESKDKEYMITHTYKDYYFIYADSGDEALELYRNGYDKEGKEIEVKNSEGIDTLVTEYQDSDPEIWICRHCKGTNVSEDTWKDINTGELTDSGLEFYCSDCMSDTKVMLKGEEE